MERCSLQTELTHLIHKRSLNLLAPLRPRKAVGANGRAVLPIDSAHPQGHIQIVVRHTGGIHVGSAGHLDDGGRGQDPKVGPR